jgi:hypothetical protein
MVSTEVNHTDVDEQRIVLPSYIGYNYSTFTNDVKQCWNPSLPHITQ